MGFIVFLKRIDWILVVVAMLLVLIGLMSIYSLTQGESSYVQFKKQVIFLAVSLAIMGIIAYIDFRIFNHTQIIFSFYAVSVLLLFAVLFLGSDVRGVSRWFRIGPVSFGPVELAKIASVFVLAKYFSMRHIEIARMRHILVSGLYIAIPSMLLLLQPDLGSILVFIVVWVGVMLTAGIKIKHLFILMLLGIMVFSLGWAFVFKDYQKERIVTFIDPERDPLGSSYNITQSIIAVGSGGLWGKGFGMGSQSQLGFLPESTTDFIFAAITEEVGFAGGAFVFLLFGILLWRLFRISLEAQNNFGRLLIIGIAIVFISQIFINTGMTMGLFPVAGIPLPFLSYGGSALVVSFLMLGVAQSVKVHS